MPDQLSVNCLEMDWYPPSPSVEGRVLGDMAIQLDTFPPNSVVNRKHFFDLTLAHFFLF